MCTIYCITRDFFRGYSREQILQRCSISVGALRISGAAMAGVKAKAKPLVLLSHSPCEALVVSISRDDKPGRHADGSRQGKDTSVCRVFPDASSTRGGGLGRPLGRRSLNFGWSVFGGSDADLSNDCHYYYLYVLSLCLSLLPENT